MIIASRKGNHTPLWLNGRTYYTFHSYKMSAHTSSEDIDAFINKYNSEPNVTFKAYCNQQKKYNYKTAIKNSSKEKRAIPSQSRASVCVKKIKKLPSIIFVYPNKSANELNEMLYQWGAVGACRVQIFDEPNRGRGVRASRLIKAGTYICLFSKFVHEGPSIKDAFYQYHDVGKTGLFASVDNYCGPIEYGVMINDDLLGDPNCKIVFEQIHGSYVAKVYAVFDIEDGEALSLAYSKDYWTNLVNFYDIDLNLLNTITDFLKPK